MKEKIKYRLGVGADAVAIDPETPDTMPDAFQSALPQELLKRMAGLQSAGEAMAENRQMSTVSPVRHFAHSTNARQIIRWFELDPARFKVWFTEWAKAPDLASMRYLLWAAEEMGVTQDAKSRANTKHAKNRESRRKVEELWPDLQAKGMKKNEAAPEMAKSIPLAESTIRRILQGL